MGVISYDAEITSSIPPAKIFRAFVLDADSLLPKILPQAIKGVEVIEGNGGPGTVKLITFGEGGQFKAAKHRVDGLDKENFTYRYSIIGGDALMNAFESISYEVKISASPDGGSICRRNSKYHTKGDAQIAEEEIKSGKERASGMFKAVEAYLLANPDAYN